MKAGLSGLGFEASLLNNGLNLSSAQVGSYRKDFVGAGRINFPGLNGFFAVQSRCYGANAVAAVDVGFEFERWHGAD